MKLGSLQRLHFDVAMSLGTLWVETERRAFQTETTGTRRAGAKLGTLSVCPLQFVTVALGDSLEHGQPMLEMSCNAGALL